MRSSPDQTPAQRRRIGFETIDELPWWSDRSARLAHGQLPLEFWKVVLGPKLHTACAFWPRPVREIAQAESAWCESVALRAALQSGQNLLEIGALPGSLARWAAAEIPDLEVTLLALDSESRSFLRQAVADQGPSGVSVSEATLQDFSPAQPFDRILAIETFTRSPNPGPLFRSMLSWLAPEGKLFAQIACHWRDSYRFEPGDEHEWMLPEVVEGSLFPGEEYLEALCETLPVAGRWEASGEHYARTLRAWRQRLEEGSAELSDVLASSGRARPERTLRAWRNALLGRETMFGFRKGQEWCLTQLLLESPQARQLASGPTRS